jgi:SAM-dependent methyltransferase
MVRCCSYFIIIASFFCLWMSPLHAEIENLIDSSIDMKLLHEAWQGPGGGSRGKPYYRVVVNGIYFDGERDWAQRWNMMKDTLDYRGKKILELGCNFAMSSAYMIKYRGASSAIGIELPDERLTINGNPNVIKAAKKFHKALNVGGIEIKQMDLDVSDYENLIGDEFDIVVCMSLLNWVKDKERLLNYLSKFPCVIYEGHDSDESEIERFLSHGFTHYEILGRSVVGISSPLHYQRTVILFTKDRL